ncbi:MAG: hypothetical protein QOJ71_3216, partial [Actinomycetota bacterium]|nr:hypothetical protein [Actinomycetota bacterium]
STSSHYLRGLNHTSDICRSDLAVSVPQRAIWARGTSAISARRTTMKQLASALAAAVLIAACS